MDIKISNLMQKSGVQFGTSGVRGTVKDMTDAVCWAYTTAFLQHLTKCSNLKPGSTIGLAGDLRSSTDRIMHAVSAAIVDLGFTPANCGKIPSPAIALYGLHTAIPTIMVTGSHIPDDRNGIKFNKADGEILKEDEQKIKAEIADIPQSRFNLSGSLIGDSGLPEISPAAEKHYIDRYLQFFPEHCLTGKHIGLYEHSSVARECLYDILTGLGADVITLDRSETFISVDTEAIRPEDVVLARQWAQEHQLDCIISTDGDGDRPLVSDERGTWLRGDVVGILCAKYLNADVVVTPISSNSAVEKCKFFDQVIFTRIGSPYVIEAMQKALDQGTVVGYEANGGFLQGNEIVQYDRALPPLPTRDAAIVPLCILMLAEQHKKTISELVNILPGRFTASDRLKDFPTELSRSILENLTSSDTTQDLRKIETIFGAIAGWPISVEQTDGLRITFENAEVIHLRPSGNAPEFRCYNEAASAKRALQLNEECMKLMEQWRK